jgi:predicted SAM-dependent methyltransferase
MRNGLRLCVGSGQRPHGFGWLNCDLQPKWRLASDKAHGEFLVCDMASMPFPDGSAEIIVNHHGYEHMDPHREGAEFLREANRVLKPGGSLLIFTPDAEALARRWLKYRDRVNRHRLWGDAANDGEIDDFTYFVNLYGAFMNHDADRHRWLHVFDTLRRFVMDAGFWSKVRPFDWRQIPGSDIARDWYVLAVEAVK